VPRPISARVYCISNRIPRPWRFSTGDAKSISPKQGVPQ